MNDHDDRELEKAMQQVRGTWRPWLLLILTLTIAGYGGYEMVRRGEAAQKIVAEVDERVAEKVAQIAVLDQSKKELERRLERVDRQNRDLIELRASDEETRKKQVLDKVRFEHLKTAIGEKLKPLGGGRARLEVGEKLVIALADTALFDGADPKISARGQEVLLAIGGVLTSTHGIELEIASHLDEIPTAWESSAARAGAIARFLAEKARFVPNKLTPIAYGASRPRSPHQNAAGRAQNRRVELRAAIGAD